MADSLELTVKKLDLVSPCFCVAKWSSVTLHLESGTTHSCHHPKVHVIPVEGLKENPAALHNTGYKIEQRKKMIEGVRPSECDYCWGIEDLKTNEYSDRVLKSASEWSTTEYGTILKDPFSVKYKPRYVEVSFSKTCQFKCSYCSEEFSTTWEEEIKKFGPYAHEMGEKRNQAIDEETNPYIEAFWQWWPELKPHLHSFRITGGEPLLSPNTFRILESLIANPEPNLVLGVNSNLGAPEVLINKFVNMIREIQEKKCVRRMDIFASIDAYGERAEYIRNGLKHDYFWKNIERILETSPTTYITIMCTFNALSVTSFEKFMQKVFELNDKYRNYDRLKAITVDIPYLRNPPHQTVRVLPRRYVRIMEKNVTFIEDYIRNNKKIGELYALELLKIKRLLEWMRHRVPRKQKFRLQGDFYRFFSEHDRRRNTSFVRAFPEMRLFWLQSGLQMHMYDLSKKTNVKFRTSIFNKAYYFSKYVLLEKIPKMVAGRK